MVKHKICTPSMSIFLTKKFLHERYFCEFREVMQAEEDKYFEEPKEHKICTPSMSIFLTKKFLHASQSCLQQSMLLATCLQFIFVECGSY